MCLYHPNDDRLRYTGTDEAAGAIDILTKVDNHDFNEFFDRAGRMDVDGEAVRVVALGDLGLVSPVRS